MRQTITISLHPVHHAVRINTGVDDGYHIIHDCLWATVEKLLTQWGIARNVVSIVDSKIVKFNPVVVVPATAQFTAIDHANYFDITSGRFSGSYPKFKSDSLLVSVNAWIITAKHGSYALSIDSNGLCTYCPTVVYNQ